MRIMAASRVPVRVNANPGLGNGGVGMYLLSGRRVYHRAAVMATVR
jgi:hypothetical protein